MKKNILFILLGIVVLNVEAQTPNMKAVKNVRPQTFCNPIDLPYRFQLFGHQREAADPVIVLYKDKYWLFASKSGGYWYSDDMVNWIFVQPEGLPIESYAPTVFEYKNKLYYFGLKGMYTTNDPVSGKWTQVAKFSKLMWDTDLFLDDDGRVYSYWGSSPTEPIWGQELDTTTWMPIGQPLGIINSDIKNRGWEVMGNTNQGRIIGDTTRENLIPTIEGSWMNKINGKYYLQYAAPGTEAKTYADGVYVGNSPLGPYTYASYSPFSHKATGFVTGVGHSATFKDKSSQYWHVTTVALSVRYMFERRLAIFPTAIMNDGQLATNTYLGDYPQYAPGTVKNSFEANSPQWMLLSLNKPSAASSVLSKTEKQSFEVSNAFDEEMTKWWSAATGNAGEWLSVDLTKKCRVDAIQVNFADQDITAEGRLINDGYRYFIEASIDGKIWKTIVDRRDVARDEPHHYIQLDKPEMARYLRIINVQSPAESKFSIYDFRIFGSGLGKAPAQVANAVAKLNASDQRSAQISWNASSNVDFYIVRYGIAPDKLFNNYQVYGSNRVDINALNVGVKYYCTVDAVNDSGVTKGTKIITIR